MRKTVIETPEDLIVEYIRENGIKMTWLAEKLGLSPGHLHCVLKGEGENKRDLTEENLRKINELWGTDF